MDRDDADDAPITEVEPEPVPSTERCVYVPDMSKGVWYAERLPTRDVVIAEPVDGPPDGDVEGSGR
jgi:hypothetical protein